MSVFEQQAALAAENFEIVYENFIGLTGMSREIHHVIAEAGTSSRYSVVVTPLGHGGRHEGGGSALVSVLSPWRSAYPFQFEDDVHWTYVTEKLAKRNPHGGDIAALTLTVARALGGTAILPED